MGDTDITDIRWGRSYGWPRLVEIQDALPIVVATSGLAVEVPVKPTLLLVLRGLKTIRWGRRGMGHTSLNVGDPAIKNSRGLSLRYLSREYNL